MAVPESNKLQIKLMTDGAPSEIKTNNEVLELRSSLNHIHLNQDKDNQIQEEEIHEHPIHEYAEPDLTARPPKIFHELGSYEEIEKPDLMNKIMIDNEDSDTEDTEFKGHINVVHPNYNHKEELYANQKKIPGKGHKFEYKHDITGHITNLDEYGDPEENSRLKLFDPTKSVRMPTEHLGLPDQDDSGEQEDNPELDHLKHESGEEDEEDFEGKQELIDIESDLKEAVGESRHENPVLVSPNALQVIVKYLKYLEQKDGEVFELDAPKSNTDKINDLQNMSSEMNDRISNMKNEIKSLHEHLKLIRAESGREKDIKALEQEDIALNAELESLELQKEKGEELNTKEAIEDLEAHKEELEKNHADAIQIAHLENKIVDLEVKDAELEEDLKKHSLTDFNKEIVDLENEKTDIESIDPDSKNIEEIGTKINDLKDEEKEIIDDDEAHHDLEDEISHLTNELNELEHTDTSKEAIDEFIEGKDKLMKEAAIIDHEDSQEELEQMSDSEEEHSDTSVSHLDPEELTALESKYDLETEVEESYEVLAHLIFALEDIKESTFDLFEGFPTEQSDIPEKGSGNKTKIINLFEKLKVFSSFFEIFNEKTEGDLEFLFSITQRQGISFDDCLSFYKIKKQYEDIKNSKNKLEQHEADKDREIKALHKDFAELIRRLAKNVDSLIRVKGLIRDEVMRFKSLSKKHDETEIEEQEDMIIDFYPKLINLKDEITEDREETKKNVKEIKELRSEFAIKLTELSDAVGIAALDTMHREGETIEVEEHSHVGVFTALFMMITTIVLI